MGPGRGWGSTQEPQEAGWWRTAGRAARGPARAAGLAVSVCAMTATLFAAHLQQAVRVLCVGAEVDARASPFSALPVLRWILPSF